MQNNFKTDLKITKNLGSSGHGSRHWLHQRISALTSMLLMVWLIVFIKISAKSDLAAVIHLLKQPFNLIALMLLLLSSFYHGLIGMQVIIEDYVGSLFLRNSIIIIMQIFCLITIISLFVALFYARGI